MSSTQSETSTVDYVIPSQSTQPIISEEPRPSSPPPRSHAHKNSAASPKREEGGAKPKPPSQRFAFQMKTTSTKYVFTAVAPWQRVTRRALTDHMCIVRQGNSTATTRANHLQYLPPLKQLRSDGCTIVVMYSVARFNPFLPPPNRRSGPQVMEELLRAIRQQHISYQQLGIHLNTHKHVWPLHQNAPLQAMVPRSLVHVSFHGHERNFTNYRPLSRCLHAWGMSMGNGDLQDTRPQHARNSLQAP